MLESKMSRDTIEKYTPENELKKLLAINEQSKAQSVDLFNDDSIDEPQPSYMGLANFRKGNMAQCDFKINQANTVLPSIKRREYTSMLDNIPKPNQNTNAVFKGESQRYELLRDKIKMSTSQNIKPMGFDQRKIP